MVVELISVGTEILLGNIVNTNASYLAEKCAALGLNLYYQTVVGDNEKRMLETFQTALERSDIVITTGGLGPTKDDLTKEIAARVFGMELKEDAHTRKRIEEFFVNSQYRVITENNWKQAQAPQGAKIIDNDNGTAPGLILEKDGKTMILLPGPPNEMVPMFEKDIVPYLNKLDPEIIFSKMVKISGRGESRVETEILDLMEGQTNPTIAPYAKTGEVHLRITAKAKDEEKAQQLMAPMIKELQNRFGNYIYTLEEKVTLPEAVLSLLKERSLTVTTAESCTGGMLSASLVGIAGASDAFQEGYVTYSNEAKESLLGVSHEILEKYGAVSEETAAEMAEKAAGKANADAALSITGIAGPGGGTPDKPVGLVYIGVWLKGSSQVVKYQLKGNRNKIREYAVANALHLLRIMLLEK